MIRKSPSALLIDATNSVRIVLIQLYDYQEPSNMPSFFPPVTQRASKISKALFEVRCCLYFGHGLRFIAVDFGFFSIAPDEFRYFLQNIVGTVKVQKQPIYLPGSII